MKVYSDDARDLNELIDSIGQFFQIRDDLANLCSKEYADSKSYCDDLTEGKFSYPVIRAIKYSDNALLGNKLLGTFPQKLVHTVYSCVFVF